MTKGVAGSWGEYLTTVAIVGSRYPTRSTSGEPITGVLKRLWQQLDLRGVERAIPYLQTVQARYETVNDLEADALSSLDVTTAAEALTEYLKAESALQDLNPKADEGGTKSSGAEPLKVTVKPKRSTVKGEGRAKLIAALTLHHKYADGSCLNLELIGNNELAKMAGVSISSASRFFMNEFKGHSKYRALYNDTHRLVVALKALNSEFWPYEFYEARTPDEVKREMEQADE